MAEALYYPLIDIRDETFLKTSLLYWDSVRTIVPEAIDSPYSTDTGRELQDANFLTPLRVHPDMEEIEELTDDVLSYLRSAEGADFLLSQGTGRNHFIHINKLPYEFIRLADIHPQKLSYELQYLLRRFHSGKNQDWLSVNEKFCNYYMTLLASRLAERVGARLLTPLPEADRLAVAARLGAQLNEVITSNLMKYGRHWREYEAYGPRQRMPRQLAHGMLANLAIEKIGISKNVSIKKLLKFKEEHRDELSKFRNKIDQLVASVGEDLPVEALRQRINNLYSDEVVPAITDLKAALNGSRIQWLNDGLLRVAFLSAGSTAMLTVAGLSVPTALLAGAGISLLAAGTKYNVDKEESLRSNPFTYLLSLERGI